MISRRTFTSLAASAALVPALAPLAGAAEVSEDGLHIQPFFMDTFLDLAEDRAETNAAGKHMAVFFEQRGCPYCKEMHEVNLAKPEIVDYIKENFGVVQINMWGSRQVTDFDGETMEERDLARKWQVHFTPTIIFLPMGEVGEGSGRDLEAIRMPGYFKPFHFLSMFVYVREEKYKTEEFQRFLSERFEHLEEQGKNPVLWE